jgi:hypothetical protein
MSVKNWTQHQQGLKFFFLTTLTKKSFGVFRSTPNGLHIRIFWQIQLQRETHIKYQSGIRELSQFSLESEYTYTLALSGCCIVNICFILILLIFIYICIISYLELFTEALGVRWLKVQQKSLTGISFIILIREVG